jgi:hypothetical protein
VARAGTVLDELVVSSHLPQPMQSRTEPGVEAGAERWWHRLRETTRRHAPLLVLAAIVVLSLLFRLHVSSLCSLWLDEVLTHMDVTKPWPQVLHGPERVHPPLLFVLVKVVVQLFGGSETSLRAVSLLFGCVLLVAVYWLCLELGLKATRALAIVALLAITPFFIRHATEARHYALYPALGTLAAAATFRVLREPERLRFLVLFAASASAMAMTHYFGLAYAFALLGVILVGLLPHWRRVGFSARVTRVSALVLVLLFCVLVAVTLNALAVARFYSKPGSGDATPWRGLLYTTVDEFSFIDEGQSAGMIQIPLAALGLLLIGWPLGGIARIVPAALGFVPCVLALFIRSGHFVAPRYLAPSWVLYHVGSCAALFAAGDRLRALLVKAPARLGPLLAWGTLAVPLAFRLAEYPNGYGAGTQYYRGLQRYFVEHLASNTRLVAFDGGFGERIMGIEYSVGSLPLRLETFRRVPGIERYLVAEFHTASDVRQARLESLVQARLGLSPEAWRELPLLDLPETIYQPAVRARIVELDGSTPMPPDKPRPRQAPRRPRRRVAPPRERDAEVRLAPEG